MQPPDCQLHHFLQRLTPFRLLEHQEKSGDTQGAEAVKKISPIAWQHINLHGRYEFQKPLDPLDVDAIIREMTGFRPDHHMAQAA